MALRNYVVLFTPRSGSSWLTAVLSATGRLGHPEEYLNPAFMPDVLRRLGCEDAQTLLERLPGSTATANGVFGIEATSLHIARYDTDAFFHQFGDDGPHPASFFVLWRANIVAQGISLYRAVKSGWFHSWEPARPPPDYAPDEIQTWIEHLVDIENENLTMLRQRRIMPAFLLYETMTGAPRQVCRTIAGAMKVRLGDDISSEAPKKIGDGWNRRAEARFRAEQGGFVTRIEAARLTPRLTAKAC